MKKLQTTVAIALIFAMGSMTTGCLGSFNLTGNVYSWNESATGNKFVNNLIFWGLVIIPVYGVTLSLDAIIFNLIEFWGGSNPISMNEGDYEVEQVNYAGIDYKVEATKNQFKITTLSGDEIGKVSVMRFDTETKTWMYEQDNRSIAIMSFEEENNTNYVSLYTPNGEKVKFNADANYSQSEIASIYKHAMESSTTAMK